jgi:hypothetical protein
MEREGGRERERENEREKISLQSQSVSRQNEEIALLYMMKRTSQHQEPIPPQHQYETGKI